MSNAHLPRYAALLVPRFRLQAVLHGQPEQGPPRGEIKPALFPPDPEGGPPSSAAFGKEPIALLDGESKRGLLLEVSLGAEALQIRPGMAASQALARSPTLRLLNASALAEEALQARLFRFVETLSPRVERRAPDQWLLDLRGNGGVSWEKWGHTALQRLRTHEGIEGTLGIAPKPDLAWCAARRAHPLRLIDCPESFLEELRFEELGASETLCEQLHDWGLSTLGDLLRLPRQDTLERLGPEAAALWEVARDSRESVLRLETFPEPFELGVDFESPIETVEPLRFSIHRLIEQFCSRLRLLQRVGSEVHLHLGLEQGAPYHRTLTIPAPCREEAVLQRILETHLETLQFDSPIVSLRLRLKAVLPDSRQLSLFESPMRDPNRFGETLARLRALVGEEAVGVPRALDSHRPDAIELTDPITAWTQRSALLEPQPHALHVHGTLLGLPLRRFRPPWEVTVQSRSHRPAHMLGPHLQGPVEDCRGPFRMSGDWWDTLAWEREEWDIQLGGRCSGLYRISRRGSTAPPSGPWFVEGFYDVAPPPETHRRSTPPPPF
jgi:protein ImuB